MADGDGRFNDLICVPGDDPEITRTQRTGRSAFVVVVVPHIATFGVSHEAKRLAVFVVPMQGKDEWQFEGLSGEKETRVTKMNYSSRC